MWLNTHHRKDRKTWRSKSLHMTFGPGVLPCCALTFFCLIPWGTEKVYLAATNEEGYTQLQSEQLDHLLETKQKQVGTRREKRGQDTRVCPQISFYPSLQFRLSVQDGELMIMESWEEGGGTPDYYLLHSLNWKQRGIDDPSLPMTPASKFLSLSLFYKMLLFINFRTV